MCNLGWRISAGEYFCTVGSVSMDGVVASVIWDG